MQRWSTELQDKGFDVRCEIVFGKRAQEILRYARSHPKLEQIWEPFRVCLTCYNLLCAVSDPRAEEVLEAASREPDRADAPASFLRERVLEDGGE